MEMEAYIMAGKMIYFGNKLHWVSLKVNTPTIWLMLILVFEKKKLC